MSFLQLLTRPVKVSDLVYGGVKPLVKRFEYRIDFFQEKFFWLDSVAEGRKARMKYERPKVVRP